MLCNSSPLERGVASHKKGLKETQGLSDTMVSLILLFVQNIKLSSKDWRKPQCTRLGSNFNNYLNP